MRVEYILPPAKVHTDPAKKKSHQIKTQNKNPARKKRVLDFGVYRGWNFQGKRLRGSDEIIIIIFVHFYINFCSFLH